jgi:hypothetical protein
METASPNSFVQNSEFNQWINDGIKILYDKLVHARGEDYYCVESAVIPLVSGIATYALPTVDKLGNVAPFYQLLEVICTDGSNYFRIMRFQRGETADAMNTHSFGYGFGTIPTAMSLRFRLGTNYIEIRPTPAVMGWGFYLEYVPTCPTLVADIDTFDGINGFEDFPVVWAAIRALTKEESDTSALTMQLKMIDDRIGKMAPNRDSSQTRRIADTRQDSAGVWSRRLRGQW